MTTVPRAGGRGKGSYPRDSGIRRGIGDVVHSLSTKVGSPRRFRAGTRKRPKEPRSLDAPTNVNTGQITRCPLPLQARPTVVDRSPGRQGTYPRLSQKIGVPRGGYPRLAHNGSRSRLQRPGHRRHRGPGSRHRRPRRADDRAGVGTARSRSDARIEDEDLDGLPSPGPVDRGSGDRRALHVDHAPGGEGDPTNVLDAASGPNDVAVERSIRLRDGGSRGHRAWRVRGAGSGGPARSRTAGCARRHHPRRRPRASADRGARRRSSR